MLMQQQQVQSSNNNFLTKLREAERRDEETVLRRFRRATLSSTLSYCTVLYLLYLELYGELKSERAVSLCVSPQ